MTEEPDSLTDTGVGQPDRLQRLWTPHRMSYIVEVPAQKQGRTPGSSAPFTEIPTLPTFHPAYLLRTPASKRQSWQDLLAIDKPSGLLSVSTDDEQERTAMAQARALLARVAGEAGLDATEAAAVLADGRYADEVREAQALYRQHGISSVPSIIIDDQYLISGGQPPEVFEQALRQIAARQA